MAGSTINTTITHGVTLGSPGYLSPLTITSTGGIAPVRHRCHRSLRHRRRGLRPEPRWDRRRHRRCRHRRHPRPRRRCGGTGGTGGSGVDLAAGSLINHGAIAGGAGGIGGTGGQGVHRRGRPRRHRRHRRHWCRCHGGQPDQLRHDHRRHVWLWWHRRQRQRRRSPARSTRHRGIGVRLESGGTLTNAGLIRGGIGLSGIADAVYFGGGASRLTLDPGASFSGAVVANAAFSNVLELASSANAGTLSGLSSEFTGFANVTIDAGASWTLVSATLGTAYTITDAGTLTNTSNLSGAGVTVVADGSLINPGTIAGSAGGTIAAGGNSLYLAGGSLTNGGLVAGGAGGVNTGVGGAGGIAIDVDAAGGSLTNDGTIAGGIGGFSTLDAGGAGGIAINVAVAGGSLTNDAKIAGGGAGNGTNGGAAAAAMASISPATA